MDDAQFASELETLERLWDQFYESFDHTIHPPPVLTHMFFVRIREQIAQAMVIGDNELTDTQRIEIAMANLCDLVMRFSEFLKEQNFDINRDITQCDCFSLTKTDVEKLLKGE